LHGTRTSVDRAEAETRAWERDCVAWNLSRAVTAAPSEPPRKAPKESGELHDSTEEPVASG